MLEVLLAVAIFLAAASIDYAHALYVRAVIERRRRSAAIWTVLQWSASTVGFVVAVKVSLWYLPLEAAGLVTGTLLAIPDKEPPCSCSR